MKITKTILLVCALVVCAAGSAFPSLLYNVSVDTTSLKGQDGYLYFQYYLNNGEDSTATVFNFASDGLLAPTSSASVFDGSAVTGQLPGMVAFGNTGLSGVNDYNHGIHFGEAFGFLLSFSDLAPGVHASGSSTFALGLFADEDGFTPLLGGDLFSVSLLNDGTAAAEIVASQASVFPVPIPAAALLFGSGLMGLSGLRRRMQS